jgi:hypothetical protein
VHKAWKVSFVREETNRLGPKVLNYNALTHPEILATKQGHHRLFVLNYWKTQKNRRFEPIQRFGSKFDRENCCPQGAAENLWKLNATAKENLKAQVKRIQILTPSNNTSQTHIPSNPFSHKKQTTKRSHEGKYRGKRRGFSRRN